jgi:hypothetical protein
MEKTISQDSNHPACHVFVAEYEHASKEAKMSIPGFTAENLLYTKDHPYKNNIYYGAATNGSKVIPQRDPMGPPEGSLSGWYCAPYFYGTDQFGNSYCIKYCQWRDPFGRVTTAGTYQCWENFGARPL